MKGLFFFAVLLMSTVLLKAQTNGETAYFIQIASYANPKYADFKKIENLGYLFEDTQSNGISRIIMGTYSSQGAANQTLAKVKAQGYKDAFINKYAIDDKDGVYVIQLASFNFSDVIQWADWQNLVGSNLYAQMSDQKVRLLSATYKTEQEAQNALKRLQAYGPKDAHIRKVSHKVIHKVTNFEISKTTGNANNITASVRSSVVQMQQFLSKQGVFKEKSDGIIGKNTLAAIENYKTNNERYVSYSLLAEKIAIPAPELYSLQYYINLIPTLPFDAEAALQQFKHPLAKVYRAYMYLNGDIQIPNYQQEVNNLMNEACTQVFKHYKLPTRSDFTMAYSYNTIEQLLRHLREVHEAVIEEPQVPCWLFQRHTDIMVEAFAPYWNNDRDAYSISSDCGSFFAFPEMKILMSISSDFSDNPDKSFKEIEHDKLNTLYAIPTTFKIENSSNLETWYKEFLDNLKALENGNALQKKTSNTLQFAFHEALISLEDFFLKKGFVAKNARSLSLQTLQLVIMPYFK